MRGSRSSRAIASHRPRAPTKAVLVAAISISAALASMTVRQVSATMSEPVRPKPTWRPSWPRRSLEWASRTSGGSSRKTSSASEPPTTSRMSNIAQ
jgi:hypothetical protein